MLFLAAIALVSPSAIVKADLVPGTALTQTLSLALAVLLIVGYGLGLLFSLKTHREIFAGAERAEPSEPALPVGLALVTLAVVTVLVALVSEIFVESVQKAAETSAMSQAFVGFIVVALVGASAWFVGVTDCPNWIAFASRPDSFGGVGYHPSLSGDIPSGQM